MAQKEKKKIDKKSEEVLEEMEKVSKKEKKKETKKEEKKPAKKEEKTVAKESWWHGVKSEFKKVRWPSKKEMVKYSIATIAFILFFALFFYLIEVIVFYISRN
jgi:preprotein translocase subunit SecE